MDFLALDRVPEGLDQHLQAKDLREALLAEEPQDARALEDAAESRFQVGTVLARLGRIDEAIAEISIAIERWRALSALDPQNARWRDVLASGLTTLGAMELERNQRGPAARTLEDALAIRRSLAEESPDFAANRTALATLEKALDSMRAGKDPAELGAALAPWR